jgi:hypothetical protein
MSPVEANQMQMEGQLQELRNQVGVIGNLIESLAVHIANNGRAVRVQGAGTARGLRGLGAEGLRHAEAQHADSAAQAQQHDGSQQSSSTMDWAQASSNQPKSAQQQNLTAFGMKGTEQQQDQQAPHPWAEISPIPKKMKLGAAWMQKQRQYNENLRRGGVDPEAMYATHEKYPAHYKDDPPTHREAHAQRQRAYAEGMLRQGKEKGKGKTASVADAVQPSASQAQ